MTFEAHPVDTLLRAAAGDPSPSYADILKGRQALAAAIAAESAVPIQAVPRPRRGVFQTGWWRHATSAALAVAVLLAVVAVTGLLRPEPVTALGELASVAEQRAPLTSAEGDYVYTRVVETSTVFAAGADVGLPNRVTVAYQLPIERERWQSADGTIFERSVVGEPVFFDAEVAAAYTASGLSERDGVGVVAESEYTNATSVLDQRDWPTDSGELLAAMRSTVSSEGNALAENAAIVELAGNMLRETGAAPALRSAVLLVLDELGLDVVERDNGRLLTVGIQYVDTEVQRLELQFDAEANLVADRLIWINDVPDLGVTAGTVIHQSQLSPARTVAAIESP